MKALNELQELYEDHPFTVWAIPANQVRTSISTLHHTPITSTTKSNQRKLARTFFFPPPLLHESSIHTHQASSTKHP